MLVRTQTDLASSVRDLLASRPGNQLTLVAIIPGSKKTRAAVVRLQCSCGEERRMKYHALRGSLKRPNFIPTCLSCIRRAIKETYQCLRTDVRTERASEQSLPALPTTLRKKRTPISLSSADTRRLSSKTGR
jgi:hypothetical protein